jgi:hypothetical protein
MNRGTVKIISAITGTAKAAISRTSRCPTQQSVGRPVNFTEFQALAEIHQCGEFQPK